MSRADETARTPADPVSAGVASFGPAEPALDVGPKTAPRGAVLLLGARGLIGSALAAALAADGWRVVGLGRGGARPGDAALGLSGWITSDLRELTTAAAWAPHLAGVDAVVNAAGALNDGPRDDLAAVHGRAIAALVAAADHARIGRIVQISAPGVDAASDAPFLATKAAGDAAVAARAYGDAVILRPGLVLGTDAYGGSALLRAAAAVPVVAPVVLAEARVQTVALADVAAAVAAAARGDLPRGADLALVAADPIPLEALVLALRGWLGVPPPRAVLRLPRSLRSALAFAAGLAVRLGWRTPLTAVGLRLLEGGVRGDPAPAAAALGRPLASLAATLAATPARAADRLAARAELLRPLVLLTLAGFWAVTGLVTLADPARAAAILTAGGVGDGLAGAVAVGGAFADIALGLAVLWRPAARSAALGMIALTAVYLAGGSILTPGLWLDPLGPLVKAVPALVLALVALALLDER